MTLDRLDLTAAEFAETTGWEIKPEGACKDERCVPLSPPVRDATESVDAAAVAERLGMPIAHDETHGLWAIGPESGGRVCSTACACPTWCFPTSAGSRSTSRPCGAARCCCSRGPPGEAADSTCPCGRRCTRSLPPPASRSSRSRSTRIVKRHGRSSMRRRPPTLRWSTKHSPWSTSSGSRTFRSRCGSTRAARSCARRRSRSRTRNELRATTPTSARRPRSPRCRSSNARSSKR